MSRDVFILGGKRTPMGEYVGALKDISAIDLGAIAARAALETAGVTTEEIDRDDCRTRVSACCPKPGPQDAALTVPL